MNKGFMAVHVLAGAYYQAMLLFMGCFPDLFSRMQIRNLRDAQEELMGALWQRILEARESYYSKRALRLLSEDLAKACVNVLNLEYVRAANGIGRAPNFCEICLPLLMLIREACEFQESLKGHPWNRVLKAQLKLMEGYHMNASPEELNEGLKIFNSVKRQARALVFGKLTLDLPLQNALFWDAPKLGESRNEH